MSSPADWETPSGAQPKAQDYSFDLDRALSSVLGVRASVPEDAFTAGTLGTERAGNGVVIDAKGVVLTIGYLVTEAETLWLNTIDGRAVPGHVLAYDQETGFGLVQALGKLDLPALPIGESQAVRVGDKVVVAGAGGPQRAVAAQLAAKQEFAGYWEYLLEEALFTAPAHPNWGGTAVIDQAGKLIGIGSLHLQQARDNAPPEHLNMVVPVDLLKPPAYSSCLRRTIPGVRLITRGTEVHAGCQLYGSSSWHFCQNCNTERLSACRLNNGHAQHERWIIH